MNPAPVLITLNNPNAYRRYAEPVQFGVALPKDLSPDLPWHLYDEQHEPLPACIETAAEWPNGSPKWLRVSTQITLAAMQSQQLLLKPERPSSTSPQHRTYLRVEQHNNAWQISTPKHNFTLHGQTGQWQIKALSASSPTHTLDWQLDDAQQHPGTWITERIEPLAQDNPVFVELLIHGHWRDHSGQRLMQVEHRVRCYAEGGLMTWASRVHNPQRAWHNGGLWDLGDPGSVHFSALALRVQYSHSGIGHVQVTPDVMPLTTTTAEQLRVTQHASGGDRWNSLNHVDASGTVPLRDSGYSVTQANDTTHTHGRAQPLVWWADAKHSLYGGISEFWQQFPSALSISNQHLELALFPAAPEHTHELQGGECKTQQLALAFNGTTDALAWLATPLVPVVDTQAYATAEVLPWFAHADQPSPIDPLLATGLSGPDNFFSKREVIDEFGWRHFGDLFADHESLYQTPDQPPFISHYNNQYDAIYGFARQFVRTGDTRWFRLMDDLARHVVDIDLYHTDADRAEYNHGLFWHTDHYLPASTATHRTYSKHNSTSSIPGQTGGGPAAEHCYTTGLAYHHFLTGNPHSKQAVLDLAGWMIALHDGGPGLLSALWAVKRDYAGKLFARLRGRKVSSYRYPLTRGTGNYLVALIDAYEVSAEQRYLDRCATIIRNTLHPQDDIDARQLMTVETGWSYLILLQALARFLRTKAQAGQYDHSFTLTRAAFLAYTDWMRQHEQPFLSDPKQLEFPNDTWVAQDVRKAMLMFQAADLDPEHAEHYRAQGQAWLDYVTQHLAQSSTLSFTRIQVILLQNHGPDAAREVFPPQTLTTAGFTFGKPPQATLLRLLGLIIGRLWQGIREFRPTRERHWWNTRMNRS